VDLALISLVLNSKRRSMLPPLAAALLSLGLVAPPQVASIQLLAKGPQETHKRVRKVHSPFLRAAREQLPGPFVVVGIGDSGTRGVKTLMERLGVNMCSNSSHGFSQDNKDTKPVHGFINALLRASKGHVSSRRHHRSKAFRQAVRAEVRGAKKTHDCIVQQLRQTNWTGSTDFPWGYKNPKHIHLLPVMDKAFHRTQRMLAVARDPRDICSGGNKEQLNKFGSMVESRWPALRGNGTEQQCLQFWADVWGDVLHEYGQDPRFRVVRIEDLVLPDPAVEGNSARKTLDCLLQHAQLPTPAPVVLGGLLSRMHSFSSAYAGNHKPRPLKRYLENLTSSMDGNFQTVMLQLGYTADSYGQRAPGHPAVCV